MHDLYHSKKLIFDKDLPSSSRDTQPGDDLLSTTHHSWGGTLRNLGCMWLGTCLLVEDASGKQRHNSLEFDRHVFVGSYYFMLG